MITRQEVAGFLLNEGFLLTALEFHQELIEDGTELDMLKKQFGAPPPQSSDLYPLSSDNLKLPDNVEAALKEKDDRLTLVEYELRMAKQQVNQLREKLHKVQSNVPTKSTNLSSSLSLNLRGNRTEVVSTLERDNVKDSEVRAANYIVMKYLLSQGYKVSAVTFEEEVSDQSVSDWEGVGLNSPAPPSLVTFYRYFYSVDPNAASPQVSPAVKNNQDALVSSLKNELEELKKRAVKAEEKHSHAKKKIDKLLADNKTLVDKLASLETVVKQPETEKTESPQGAPATTTETPKKTRKPRRTYAEVDPNPFNIVEETESYTRITQELRMISQEKDFQSLVHILGDALPYIVPGVILKKREELIPVILSAISQHPDPNSRYSLTQVLFNLIRRPNEYERKILVDGFEALAQIIGEERTERELLPQCWEQIHDDHDERRVLVADSCGAVSKFVRSELRPSLILSILQQLSQDKSQLVRTAVARNLSVLISCFDTNDKYGQIEELVFDLLNDSEDEVRAMTIRVLLPVFADWSDEYEWMCSKFLNKYLSEIEQQLSSTDDHAMSLLFTGFKSLLPRIRDSILWSIPVPENGPTESYKILAYRTEQLSSYFEKESSEKIPELEWLYNVCLPKFALIILKLDFSKDKLVGDFITLISAFCTTFGESFTAITMKKMFTPHLEKETRAKVLPIYLTGVIATIRKKDVFITYLKQIILNVAAEENGWKRTHKNALRESVRLLSKTDRKEEVIGLCGELVTYPASHVRGVIVALYDALTAVLHADEVTKRLLPALITLSADPDAAVRVESIQALAQVTANTDDPTVLEKVKTQMESFIEDDNHNNRVTITRVFTSMIPHMPANYRDHFILPNLVKITERNSRNADTSHRTSLSQQLFEAYRAYTGALIDEESVKERLLPGLKLLQKDADHMDPAYKSMIGTMIAEFEASLRPAFDDHKNVPPPAPVAPPNPNSAATMGAKAQATTKALFDKMRKVNVTGFGVPATTPNAPPNAPPNNQQQRP